MLKEAPYKILIIDDTGTPEQFNCLQPRGYELAWGELNESLEHNLNQFCPHLLLCHSLRPDLVQQFHQLNLKTLLPKFPLLFIGNPGTFEGLAQECYPYLIDYIKSPFSSIELLEKLKIFRQINQLKLTIVEQQEKITKTETILQSEIANRQLAEVYLKQSEIRFEKLAQNLPGTIYRYCLKGEHNYFSYLSAGSLSLLGLHPLHLQQNSQLFWDLVLAEDQPSLKQSIKDSARTLTPWEWEGRVQVDQKIKWIAMIARPEKFEWDDEIFWDGLMIDITQRKLAETKLQEQKNHLEESVKQRTLELETLNNSLRKTLQAHHQTEAALRLSEERYAIAVSGSGIGVWDWDLTTHELYISPSIKAILGYENQDIGKYPDQWEPLVYPDDKAIILEAIQAHLAQQTPACEIECRMIHKNGQIRWLLTRGKAIRNAQDQPYRMVGTVTDITERKQIETKLKASEEFLDYTLNAIADPIFVKDKNHRWIRVNQAFCQFLGLTLDQLIGKTADQVFPQDKADLFWKYDQEVLQTGIENQHEETLINPDGKTVVLSIKKTRFQDAKGQNILVGIIRDITELVTAKEAALETSHLKTQFLANVSHELRTPMNGIIGMTDLLLRTHLTPQQYDFVKTLQVSAKHLLELINDILDFSELEAGKMQLVQEDFNLKVCLADVATLLITQAQAKGLRLHTIVDSHLPEFVGGDEHRLRQILTNLVDNAIKFTTEGEIVISVQEAVTQPLPEIEGQISSDSPGAAPPIPLRFAVKDTGIGIHPEHQKKLFQSFSQVDGSTTRIYGGTGLGLVICKELVELMGGEIGVRSGAGQGSEFWFIVPLTVAQPVSQPASVTHPAPSIPAPPPPRQKLRVLLVEDTPINQKVVMNQLKVLGYVADSVNNGQEALEKMAQCSYDLVLMDCQMPVLDGYQATQRIREMEGLDRHTLIIALTANAMVDDREKCLAAGMDDYISKPVSLSELGKVIRHWTQNLPTFDQLETFALSPPPTSHTFSQDLQNTSIGRKIPIDWERLHELSQGDTEFEQEVLQTFVTDAETYLADANHAFTLGDYQTLMGRAHQIKGGSSTVAIQGMPEIAAQLERQIRTHQLEEIPILLTQLESMLRQVKDCISQGHRSEQNGA